MAEIPVEDPMDESERGGLSGECLVDNYNSIAKLKDPKSDGESNKEELDKETLGVSKPPNTYFESFRGLDSAWQDMDEDSPGDIYDDMCNQGNNELPSIGFVACRDNLVVFENAFITDDNANEMVGSTRLHNNEFNQNVEAVDDRQVIKLQYEYQSTLVQTKEKLVYEIKRH